MSTPGNSLNITEEGIVVYDGAETFYGRTLVAGTGISIDNPTGVGGDPTIYVTNGVPVTGTGTDNHIVRWDGTGVPYIQDGVSIETDTGEIQVGDGAQGTPSLTYVSDTTQGFFKVSSGVTGFSSGGVKSVELRAAGVRLPDGSNGTPSISFINDTDTGLYSITGNQMGFAAGGNLKAQVTSNGLGITNGNVSGPALHFINDSDTGFYRDSGGSGETRYSGNNSYTVALDSTGIKVANGAVGTPSISFINDTDNGLYYITTDNFGIALGGVKYADLIGTSGVMRMYLKGGIGFNLTLSATDIVLDQSSTIVGITSTAATRTVTLPSGPSTGFYVIIKDQSGAAGTNPINVVVSGGIKTIDGLTTYPINTNYGSISVYYDPTSGNYFVI